jgi:hypothetical protein
MTIFASAAAIGSSLLSSALGAGIVGGVGTGALGLSAGAIGAAGSALGAGVAGGALGAGVGAISAAAQGQDVGKGALMGGLTGAAGGGLVGGISGAAGGAAGGGAGGAAGGGAGGVGSTGTTVGTGGSALAPVAETGVPAAQMSTTVPGSVMPQTALDAAISGAPNAVTPMASSVLPAAPSAGGSMMPTLGQVGTGLQVVGKGAEMLAPKPPQGGPIKPAPVMPSRNQIPYTKPVPRGMGRFGGM